MAQADYVTNANCAPITDASPKPSTNPVRAACAGFIPDLAGPRLLSSAAVDLERRADHLRTVLNDVAAYLTGILRDTANLPGRINLRQVDSLLSDLAPDLTGTPQHAAVNAAAWRVS